MTKVGMPVSWQMGPASSFAMSIFDRMMLSACADCVAGVSDSEAIDMAARTSAGRLVDVCVISSSKLLARNCIVLVCLNPNLRHHPGLDRRVGTGKRDDRLVALYALHGSRHPLAAQL